MRHLSRCLFLTTIAVAPCVSASHPETWLPSDSAVDTDLTKVVFGSDAFVALAPNREGGSTVIRSGEGSHWEAVDLPAEVHLNDLTFGVGRFVAVGATVAEDHEPGVALALVSEDGRDWTAVDGFDRQEDSPVGIGYVQDRFWMTWKNSSLSSWSSDGFVWTDGVPSPPGSVPVEFGDELLFPHNRSIYRGTLNEHSIEWFGQQGMDSPVVGIAAGSDRVVAAVEGNNYREASFLVSGDGSVWIEFPHSQAEFRALESIDGGYWAVGSGVEMPDGTIRRAVVSSRDGARWADRSNGIGEVALRSIAGGHGLLVAVGEGGAIFHRSSELGPAIISQPPESVSLASGHPLLLAVEAEESDGMSVVWRKDGQAISGEHELTLEISSVAPGDAGSYTAFLTNDAGSVESAPAEVTVGAASSEAIPWAPVADFDYFAGSISLHADLSRIAVGDGKVFALGHEGDFVDSLRGSSSIKPLPVVRSENGLHWQKSWLKSSSQVSGWSAAGFANGYFWMGGGNTLALSRDGIAWRGTEMGGVTLVGEHQGQLFATSGRTVWTSENGEEWNQMASFDVPWAGGYVSDGDQLYIASAAGEYLWDGEEAERMVASSTAFQPRLISMDGVSLHMARDGRDHPLKRSDNLESWTNLLDTLQGSRDLIAHNGNFMAVGPQTFETSSDGIWWAERPVHPDFPKLNACAVNGGFLYAVGDSTVLRRPAAMEPAFYQHPNRVGARSGQPVRMSVRTSGTGPISYQWYHDGDPVDGATGSTLEIEEVRIHRAGEYRVVATNALGSVSSETAQLVVHPNPPRWLEVTEFPKTPVSYQDPSEVVSANGRILAFRPEDNILSVSEDGGSWVRTRAALGSVMDSLPDIANGLFQARDKFFAAGEENLAVSSDGITWEVLPFPHRISSVTYGNGVYVFGGSGPHGGPTYWSDDLKTWSTTSDLVNKHVVFGNGRFVGVSVQGIPVVSDDGINWSAVSGSRENPLPVGSPPALTFGNGYFLLATTLDGASYLFRSTDGEHWEGPWSSDPIHQLGFHGDNFWRSTDGPSALSASSDGVRWVDREADFPHSRPLIARADPYDILALGGQQVFRRSSLLEPIFYDSPEDEVLFAGEDVHLSAPEAHGTSVRYQWLKSFIPIASGPFLEFSDPQADDAGEYRIRARNSSGEDDGAFFIHYVGGYDDWAEIYHRYDGPRESGDDPGGFGIPNLMRYALDLDPEKPDRSELPRIDTLTHNGKDFLALQFQLLDGMEDFEWWIEASPDLVEWESIQWGYVEENEKAGRVRKIVVRDVEPLEMNDRRFLRLGIERVNTGGSD